MTKVTPKVAVSVVFVCSMFLSILDTTIVNVALPRMAESFGVPVGGIGAIVTGYLVSLAVVIPASGWLADRFGYRKIFLVALAVFTLASALCGLAQNEGQLIAFRVLQGVGGGMMTPVGFAMLLREFPPAERLRANQVLMVPTALAPACGPVVGGLLVDTVGWRWVFYVNVPIGIGAFLFGLLTLPDHGGRSAGRFDLAGFVLAGAGFAGVMYALTEGSALGWTSPEILGAAAAGFVLLVLLVRVESRKAEPMVRFALYGDRLFRRTSSAAILSTAGFMGVLFLVPLTLQANRGLSALQAGLCVFPEALGVMLGSRFMDRLYSRLGPRRLMAGSLGLVALLIPLAGVVPLAVLPVVMFALGYVMSHVFGSVTAAAFATVPAESSAQASTLFNAQRQLGAALGVATAATCLTLLARSGDHRWAFAVTAVFSLVGALLALRIPDEDAAATMGAPASAKNTQPAPA
ncbi:DHA2 family efflux MFS transporter permease subunit [Actinocorallia populi]|uniref:DHA2 family efflux MFS transporter permease subunit n=1 Tax=Actinocorallia populi TaxID=2079200 RepID=UPI000D096B4F|nr:DHA2 family efflux MFS transporter permease subunit [Actinocorallia populi]